MRAQHINLPRSATQYDVSFLSFLCITSLIFIEHELQLIISSVVCVCVYVIHSRYPCFSLKFVGSDALLIQFVVRSNRVHWCGHELNRTECIGVVLCWIEQSALVWSCVE